MSQYLSYAQFIKDVQNFKKSGKKSGHEFNKYDTPTHKYFKILFYFGGTNANLAIDATGDASGLLSPTWEFFTDDESKTDYYNYNSAWAYLKMNDENERADQLKQFVSLLSNISTYSPWYFTTIGGISEALERKAADDDKFEIGEPKKLTITCLPDAFDNRIGTLLELYRSITWSWVQKKEILPVNMRKFDMAIYMFESPVINWHKTDENEYDHLDDGFGSPSYKMLEFHDCEFSYNSIKSGWSDLNNQEGFTPSYTIEISYNDCYEISHNEMILKTIGDIISTDTYQTVMIDGENSRSIESLPVVASNAQAQAVSNKQATLATAQITTKFAKSDNTYISYGNLENNTRSDVSTKHVNTRYEPGFLQNAVGAVAGHLVADVKSLLKRAVLGNIHTYSLTNIKDQLSDLAQGNLIKTGMTVAQYVKSGQQRAAAKIKGKPSGDMFPEPIKASQIPLGNIFE